MDSSAETRSRKALSTSCLPAAAIRGSLLRAAFSPRAAPVPTERVKTTTQRHAVLRELSFQAGFGVARNPQAARRKPLTTAYNEFHGPGLGE